MMVVYGKLKIISMKCTCGHELAITGSGIYACVNDDCHEFIIVHNSVDVSVMDTIKNTTQHTQVQYDLKRQLSELRIMANKLGLYDASDFLSKFINNQQ